MLPEKVRQLVGRRARTLRQEQGLSASELARVMDKTRSLVSQFEAGLLNFTNETLNLFAEALGHDELDFYVFPERNVRHAVIDLTRQLDEESLHEVLEFVIRTREDQKKSEERKRRQRERAKL
jgi:transcriptional regulator with XRE-family HTH domain